MKTVTLPKYAYQERSPRAGGECDLWATFQGDDRDSITICLEYGEGETFYLNFMRSGFGESRFSKPELAKVIEVSSALFAAL